MSQIASESVVIIVNVGVERGRGELVGVRSTATGGGEVVSWVDVSVAMVEGSTAGGTVVGGSGSIESSSAHTL